MNSIDLLERSAERGTKRGAANIWANAQPGHQPESPRSGQSMFRFVLAIGVLGLGIVLALALGTPNETETADVAQADFDDGSLPLPLLIEGAQLTDSLAPCQDFLECEPASSASSEMNDLADEFGFTVENTLIFASVDEPFEGPVFVVENIDSGFRTWSINMNDEARSELAGQVVLDGDEWVLPPESGLIEAARLPGLAFPVGGWQFNFENDDRSFLLQPLRATQERPATEWDWIVPLVRDKPDVGLRIIDVLGQVGVLVEIDQTAEALEAGLSQEEVDQLIIREDLVWVDGEYTYRFTSSRFEAPFDQELETTSEQLTLVDRDVWLAAVDDTIYDEDAEAIIIFSVLGAGLLVFVIAATFVLRRILRVRNKPTPQPEI